MKTLWGFIVKETKQTLRDPRMAFLLLVTPIIQLTLFGFAISNEIKNIRVGFVQSIRDVELRSLERKAHASGWFSPLKTPSSLAKSFEQLTSGKFEALVIGPEKDLSKAMGQGEGKIQLLLDATDLLRARTIERYLSFITQNTSDVPVNFKNPIETKILYNPSLASPIQMVPGVVCMIVCVFTIILTSMSITKERERGTLEMLLVSPIKKWQIIAGKSIPFFLLGLLDIFLIVLAGILIFNVPFRGSLFYYTISSMLFLIATIGIGLLISSIAQTQQQAMLGGFIFLFPALLLSGFMTPICNMPEALQWLANANPLTHFVTLSRNIMIKGGSPEVLKRHLSILFLMAIAVFTLAIWRMKKNI